MSVTKFISVRAAGIGAGALVLLGASWWTWKGVTMPPAGLVKPTPPAFVQVVGSGAGVSDQVLRERAELFDPTPLFFPTAHNYGQKLSRANLQRDSTQVFPAFEPQFTFSEQGASLGQIQKEADPESLPQLLASGNQAPFVGLGAKDAPRVTLPARSAYIEVTRFSGGKPLLSIGLRGIPVPQGDFVPLEYLLVVAAEGVVGDLALASSSGLEEVDAFFRSYLLKSFRIGERLTPGRYRVVVGP